MIDVHTETLIDLTEACRRAPLGPCHISAAYRWINRGARAIDGSRVKLEVIKLPKGLATSVEAVSRFITKLTHPDAEEQPQLTPAAVRREQLAAERELDALGL